MKIMRIGISGQKTREKFTFKANNRARIAFRKEVERGARARHDWDQYYMFRTIRDAQERQLPASLMQAITTERRVKRHEYN
jgi:hypothetical protein